MSALQLDDAGRDAVEKIAVVRDEETRAGVAREEVFEPLDAAGVEMVRRFVEDEKIGPREQRAAQRDAAFFSAGKCPDDPLGIGRVQIRDKAAGATVEIPSVEVFDLREKLRAARTVGRCGFVLGDAVEDELGTGKNVSLYCLRVVEIEDLRQVAGDEVAPPREFPAIRLQRTRGDAEERGFPTAIATHEPDALALANGERGAVEHGRRAVAHHEFAGADDGVESGYRHWKKGTRTSHRNAPHANRNRCGERKERSFSNPARPLASSRTRRDGRCADGRVGGWETTVPWADTGAARSRLFAPVALEARAENGEAE